MKSSGLARRARSDSAGVALIAALMVPAGCYGPSLRDCTVSCAAPSDCAGDQVCGNDGLCVAPDHAGTCATAVPPDAAPLDAARVADAAPIDAAPPDAPRATGTLRVEITGKGSVIVDGRGICSAAGGPGPSGCTYDIALGVVQTVRAVPLQLDQRFTSWTSETCSGQLATCMFTPVGSTTIVARFDKAGGSR
jgi:hypothetical protein